MSAHRRASTSPRSGSPADIAPARTGGSRKRTSSLLLGALLVAITFTAYLPATKAGYIWDDDAYLTKNELLLDGSGLRRVWIPSNTPQYYPVVFTTFWIERQLWGLRPAGYHIVNIALHALNAWLAWRLCKSLRIRAAWFIAAIFALHPVHVESVAWITERKNVLSGAFYLLAAIAYLRFVEQSSATERSRAPEEHREASAHAASIVSSHGARWWWYGLSLVTFVMALLSKTVTCSLPVALILMMVWRRDRITVRRLAQLAPMFAIGVALALNTAHLERTHVGAAGADFDFTFIERSWIACRALVFYPQKLAIPWPLAFVYPRWTLATADPLEWWPLAILLVIVALLAASWWRGARGPALASAFFATTIFPALGFFDVYPMRYSFVADHFAYLASLGLIALVVAGVATLADRFALVAVLGAAMLVGLAALTWNQCAMYSNEEALWTQTARRNPSAWIAHNNLGKLASERGAHADALAHLQLALAETTSASATDQVRFNLAVTLGKLGRHAEALEQYRLLARSAGGMQTQIAQTLERLGRDEEAESAYRRALQEQMQPDTLLRLGMHFLRRGRPADAVEWLERLAQDQPQDANAAMVLADAYAAVDRLDDAVASASSALAIARARGDERLASMIERRLREFRAGTPSAPTAPIRTER